MHVPIYYLSQLARNKFLGKLPPFKNKVIFFFVSTHHFLPHFFFEGGDKKKGGEGRKKGWRRE